MLHWSLFGGFKFRSAKFTSLKEEGVLCYIGISTNEYQIDREGGVVLHMVVLHWDNLIGETSERGCYKSNHIGGSVCYIIPINRRIWEANNWRGL